MCEQRKVDVQSIKNILNGYIDDMYDTILWNLSKSCKKGGKTPFAEDVLKLKEHVKKITEDDFETEQESLYRVGT